jgi:Outer membrane protein beta-barrel domain
MVTEELNMRSLRLIAFVTIVLALSALPARADGFITPFIGYHFGGDSADCASLTTCQAKHTNFGVSIGKMGSIFGFEEDIAFAQDFFPMMPGDQSSVFTAMSNLMIGIPAGPVQPYGIVGVGLVRPHVHASINPTAVGGDSNAAGYDIGGGVNIFFLKNVGVRGDIRHFHTLQDVSVLHLGTLVVGQKLDFNRASVGLTLKF